MIVSNQLSDIQYVRFYSTMPFLHDNYVFQPYPEIESPGIDIEAKYFLWKFHQAKGFQGKRRMKNIN